MGLIKDQEKRELLTGLIGLIAGAIAIGFALILLAVVIFGMKQCGAESPESTEASTTQSTAPTEPTLPALAENPYRSGDFAYRNGYLTCISGDSMLGVDVSSHQNYIDWAQVADAGIEFAMIRIGYRGYGNGETVEDTMWKTNLQGAREQGLPVGIYFFSQAITVEEAIEEAQLVLQWLDGTSLQLPIVFDWEPISDTARTANMDAGTLQACAMAFCSTVEAAGYQPMVYFNIDVSTRFLDLQQLQLAGCQFWLAMYKDTMTYPYQIEMWQYTDGGSVPGITGNVDLNLYFTYQ